MVKRIEVNSSNFQYTCTLVIKRLEEMRGQLVDEYIRELSSEGVRVRDLEGRLACLTETQLALEDKLKEDL